MTDLLVKISDDEFDIFQRLVYSLIGINLTEQKKTLIVSRLAGRIRQLELSSFAEYLNYINTSQNSIEEIKVFINKITTNETSFFREQHHFDFLSKNIFNKYVENKTRKIRIWSSACSSGEEPYSIAMTFKSSLIQEKCSIKILASDINTDVLDKAKQGFYTEESLNRSLPQLYWRFFEKNKDGNYQIKDDIKKLILFNRINLMDKTFPIGEPLDIIFCRNVMIYFDNQTRVSILDKFYNYMNKDAYLFMGHSENIMNITNKFKLIEKTVYKKV